MSFSPARKLLLESVVEEGALGLSFLLVESVWNEQLGSGVTDNTFAARRQLRITFPSQPATSLACWQESRKVGFGYRRAGLCHGTTRDNSAQLRAHP
jgi:hypothetical protein